MLICFSTWIGFGNYMAGLITIAFIISLFFVDNRKLIFNDKALVILLLIFTINNVISSLFSIDKLTSTLLSLLWFLVIFIPISFVKFALNEDENNTFLKWIGLISIVVAGIIISYMLIIFISDSLSQGPIFKRYRFKFLGKQQTSDTLIITASIGYGWLREKRKEKYLWLGFLFLLFCSFGIVLTEDRGGAIALFFLLTFLLIYDYKRLTIFFILFIILLFLSLKLEIFFNFRYLYDYITSAGKFKWLKRGAQLDTFKSALLMINDHWLLGVGTNNFSKWVKQYGSGTWYAYAHNFVLQFWAENGLIGMITAVSIIGLVIYRWIKLIKQNNYKYLILGFGCAFIGLLISNLTNSTIWIISIAISFWIIAGTINGLYEIIIKPSGKVQGGITNDI